MARTDLQCILPPDLAGFLSGELEVPEWAFLPDGWSFAFLRGLCSLAESFSGQQIWEVGVGTGLNQMLLGRWCPSSTFFFSDYNPQCVPLALRNLGECGVLDERFIPLPGQWDLVERVDALRTAPSVDVLIACIPQVPEHLDLTVGDNLAHYYDPDRYKEASLHAFGLGLNEALLRRAHRVLYPGGRVILNLGGRPGLQRLLEMFRRAEFTPRLLHQETVHQHMTTSLASLASLEVGAHEDFEFFADGQGTVRLNAREAEARRLEGVDVYHNLYVIEGTMP